MQRCLVITDEGKTTAYYINKDGFIIVPEFLTIKSSSDTRLSIDTTGYEIEGKKGTMACSGLYFDE